MPDGTTTVILQGKNDSKLTVISEEPYISAIIKDFAEDRPDKNDTEFLAILDSIKRLRFKL
jgi:ATP-dependent Lon protease